MSVTTDDLDDDFEFNATKERLEQGVKAAQTKLQKEDVNFIKHRVFFNHVDTFNVKHIAAYLTDQIYGATNVEDVGEEGEAEEEPEVELKTKEPEAQNKYEIIGTLKKDYHTKSEDILFTLSEDGNEKRKFKSEILKCGYIVYDITQDASEIPKALQTLLIITNTLDSILQTGPKSYRNYDEVRTFILISTVMTWGKTKPVDPEDPSLAFTETNYKKRKSHPNYSEHIACERTIMTEGRKYKDHLKIYVVCSGIIYGQEEEDFAPLFKLAWYNVPYLPCFLPGNNHVPVIHIGDLARVLHKLMDLNPGKPQYILAVEQTPVTLRNIIKAIAKVIGNEKIRDVSAEEAFLYDEITQKIFERCTIDLRMEPEAVLDTLQVEFQSEFNFSQNMKKISNEFITSRNLTPKKVIIHGPPASGKTKLAEILKDTYGLYYVSVKTMIEDTLHNLNSDVEDEKRRLKMKENKLKQKELLGSSPEEDLGENMEEEEEGGNIEEWQEQIREITSTIEQSVNKKLPDEYVIRLLRSFLMKNFCQNQGYILDGFPKTYEQAKELFGQSAEEGEEAGAEEEEAGEIVGNANSKLLPDFVISLQAEDEFLCERIIQLPEKEVQGTHYNEEGMLRRLAEFRSNNTEDNTVLNFYDEIEIHPIIIQIKDELKDTLECISEYVFSVLGDPVTFALSAEEEEELIKLTQEKNKLKIREERLKKQAIQDQCQKEFQDNMEKWCDLFEQFKIEEEKLLTAQSEPLRFYLMKYIFPTLTKGLIETVRVKPNDPIDFLAEYLFKENPEGKMFDPSYTANGEELLKKYASDVESILKENVEE